MSISIGDRVCHSAKFLRSIQWHLNVPRDGKVVAIKDYGDGFAVAEVLWPNNQEGKTDKINIRNLVLASERHLQPA